MTSKPDKTNKKSTKKTITNPIPKRPVGSPKGSHSKYRPEYCQIVKALASKGFIDAEICKILNVTNATLIKWKKEHPDFNKSLKEGKAEPDDKVVSALLENALGGTYIAKKPIVVSDGIQAGSHVEIAEFEERIPPNVTAQIFWLKNRKPENWKDKQELEHSGSVGYKVIPDDIDSIDKEE